MKKAVIIIIIILLLAGGGYAWYYFAHQTIKTKAAAIPVIASYTGTAQSAYSSFGDSYLISWANAIKSKSPTFTDSGNTYNSTTGKNVTSPTTTSNSTSNSTSLNSSNIGDQLLKLF